MPEFKAVTGRTTGVLGNSVAGYKLKPSVIRHRVGTQGLRPISEHTRQCASGKRSRGDPALLPRCPYASEMGYCVENNMLFKILLIYNAPRHPSFMDDLHPNS